LFSRCCTTSTLVFTGDLLTQTIMEKRGPTKKKGIDYIRLARAATLGFCIIAPSLHIWYTLTLPKILTKPFFATWKPLHKNIAGVCIDQSFFACWIISNYMFWSSMLKDANISNGIENVKTNLPLALPTNWKIWPFVTFINLTFVPIIYRVLVVNFVSIFWNFYLAWLTNSKAHEKEMLEEQAKDKLA